MAEPGVVIFTTSGGKSVLEDTRTGPIGLGLSSLSKVSMERPNMGLGASVLCALGPRQGRFAHAAANHQLESRPDAVHRADFGVYES